MEDISTLIFDFQDYANSLNSGHIKSWKANSMIMILADKRLPIITDNVRLFAYLTNCLEMEGFRPADIKKIQSWLIENVAA